MVSDDDLLRETESPKCSAFAAQHVRRRADGKAGLDVASISFAGSIPGASLCQEMSPGDRRRRTVSMSSSISD